MLTAMYTNSHELETQPRRPSRPYNLAELIIIPQETDEKLTDPRSESTSISSEKQHILNQEYEISASLSELDLMLRQLESEDAQLPSAEEETNVWTVIDNMGTIANDFNQKWGNPPRYKLCKKIGESFIKKLMILAFLTTIFLRNVNINMWHC